MLLTGLMAFIASPASGQTVQNGSFEDPAFSLPPALEAYNYYYDPVVPYWSFAGSAGIIGGTATLFNTPDIFPDGNQVAFLQSGWGDYADSRISQSITLAASGTYALTFSDAGRLAGCCGGNVIYDVFLGAMQIGQGSTATDEPFSTNTFLFETAAGTYDLAFALDASTPAGDNTAFIDDVQIDRVTTTPEPTSLVLLGTAMAAVAGGTRRHRRARRSS